ncbi:hypothetical protein SADUNF_Sadunf13G0081600 [Salix dunnii]|uniref:GST N-terminal domain-containing protein n=1 Tax=Salix dunnii TaxID=1413687 RepID=A0A835JLD8_9ROSI|nr:hypothetical protein SADUNF_Sadunf13G0081600 [Salix dunnii]
MSLLSPKSSPLALHPSTDSPASNNRFSFPLTSIRVSTLNHKHSLEYFSNRNRVSLRKRFHVKSPDSDTTESVSASSDGSSSSSTTSFLSFLCPLLKLFSGGDPSQERNYTLEVATSSLSSLARLPWGSRSLFENLNNQETTTSDPPKPLQLYEFGMFCSKCVVSIPITANTDWDFQIKIKCSLCTEACPFCRRVREAMTELDLSTEVYPCPKGSVRHREIVRKIGGKEQFPFLVDPNTGVSIYESGDIVKYLFQQYGKGRSPSTGLLESTLFTGWVPTILRAGRGMTLWEKARLDPPSKKLELFSFENNPNARLVREALCELELPYILQNVGTGSQRTKLLVDVSGFQEVPYLIDPNTGAEIGDYRKILAYLFQTYSAAAA